MGSRLKWARDYYEKPKGLNPEGEVVRLSDGVGEALVGESRNPLMAPWGGFGSFLLSSSSVTERILK